VIDLLRTPQKFEREDATLQISHGLHTWGKHQTHSRHPTGQAEKMLLVDDIASLQCCMFNIMHCSIVMDGLRTHDSTKLIDDTVDIAAVSSLKTF